MTEANDTHGAVTPARTNDPHPSTAMVACESPAPAGNLVTISVMLPSRCSNILTPAKIRSLNKLVLQVLAAPSTADTKKMTHRADRSRTKTSGENSLLPAGIEMVRSFIDAQCVTDISASERAGILHSAYLAWAAQQNRLPLSVVTFGLSLRALGFRRQKSSSMIWWGLRLRQRDSTS